MEAEVGDLAHLHLVDAGEEAGEHQRQQVAREAGVDAAAVEARAALGARRLEPGEVGRRAGRRVDEADRGDDVGARRQEAAEDVDVGVQRGVHHAVGPEGDDGVDVVGGEHPGGADAGQLTGVLAHLVGVGDVDADQLVDGVVDDVADGDLADRSGGPLHDAVRGLGHQVPSGVR